MSRIAIDCPALLAPLSGVTDVAMRRIARRFGAGLVVSEMVAADGLAAGEWEASLRAEGTGITPHVVQIAGCDPHWMGEGAKVAEGAGAAAIDINMGCPAKRVTGGWSGSALMRDLDHAAELIAATVTAVSIPVSVKMRLGWDRSSINAPELARRAWELGVGMVTVHARTRQDFYKGSATWADVAEARAAFGGYLVINGDIDGIAAARSALEASHADAVMIGRAAIGRPWLVAEVGHALAGKDMVPPSGAEKTEAACEHYEGLLSLYGRDMGIRHARKHLAAYVAEAGRHAAGTPAGHAAELAAIARAIVTSTDPDEVIVLLRAAFGLGQSQRIAA